MNTDSRSELERWFDDNRSKIRVKAGLNQESTRLVSLVEILKKERDAWKGTALANEQEIRRLEAQRRSV